MPTDFQALADLRDELERIIRSKADRDQKVKLALRLKGKVFKRLTYNGVSAPDAESLMNTVALEVHAKLKPEAV